MNKHRNSRVVLAALSVVLFAAIPVLSAENDEIITGRDLLRMVRENMGNFDKSAYVNRTKKAAIPHVTEETLLEEILSEQTPSDQPQPIPWWTETATEAEMKTPPKPVVRTEKATGDKLLQMVPAESLFCVRVNNLDSAVGALDQFTAGASPIPLAMLVRMQLAGILGDPQLMSLNTGGNFAVFAISPENSTDDMMIAGLLPISNFQQFVSNNANCAEPDANGISKITTADMTGQTKTILITKLGEYALLAAENNYDKLVELAKSISNSATSGLAGVLDEAETKRAVSEPLWAYGNPQSGSESFGDIVPGPLGQIKLMAEAMKSGGQQNPANSPVPSAFMSMDFAKIISEIKFLSLSITPKPNSCRFSIRICATDGSETANMFTTDSEIMRAIIEAMEAVNTEAANTDTASVLALLGDTDKADFAGTYNLIKLINMSLSMAPMPIQPVEIKTKSAIALMLKADNGKVAIDIALPKEHMQELMAAQAMMQQQMMMQMSQPQPQTP